MIFALYLLNTKSDIDSRNSGIPFEGVYPWYPSLIALIAASCIFIGVAKSGCPIPKLIISLPLEARSFALARIEKAVSVSKLNILFETYIFLI